MTTENQKLIFKAIQCLTEANQFSSLKYILENTPKLSFLDKKYNVLNYVLSKKDNFSLNQSNFLQDLVISKARAEFSKAINKKEINLSNLSIPDSFFDSHVFANKIKNFEKYKIIIDNMNNINQKLNNGNTMAHHMSGFLSVSEIQYFEGLGMDFWQKNKNGMYPLHYALFRLESEASEEGFLYLLKKAKEKQLNINLPKVMTTEDALINNNCNQMLTEIKIYFNRANIELEKEISFFHFLFVKSFLQEKSFNKGIKNSQNFFDSIFNDSALKVSMNKNILHCITRQSSDWFYSEDKDTKEKLKQKLFEKIDLLWNKDCEVNAKDHKDNTVAHYLAKGTKEQKEVLILLLKTRNDIDLNIRNYQNKTPAECINKKVYSIYQPIIENYQIKNMVDKTQYKQLNKKML